MKSSKLGPPLVTCTSLIIDFVSPMQQFCSCLRCLFFFSSWFVSKRTARRRSLWTTTPRDLTGRRLIGRWWKLFDWTANVRGFYGSDSRKIETLSLFFPLIELSPKAGQLNGIFENWITTTLPWQRSISKEDRRLNWLPFFLGARRVGCRVAY